MFLNLYVVQLIVIDVLDVTAGRIIKLKNWDSFS